MGAEGIRPPRFTRPVWVVLGILAIAPTGAARAEIGTDGTVGPRVDLAGPEFAIGAELGQQGGSNLFHSFERFSLATGERATFSGPEEIRNIISRVTGGEPSGIDGTIRSTIAGADFYLLNPAGVMFGPNARLDVQGSFHVSTADELRFADGGTFSAAFPAASSFSVAAPEAFGFLGALPAGLLVDRSRLGVPPGEALSLVGGDVTVRGSGGAPAGGDELPTLRAEAGLITLAAVGGPGLVRVHDAEVRTDAGGAVQLTDGARIDVIGDGGGMVRIRAGTFVAADRSAVVAGNTGAKDSGGGIDLRAATVSLHAGSRLADEVRGSGGGGRIAVAAGQVEVGRRSTIESSTYGPGDAGDVVIEAERLRIVGDGGLVLRTGIGSQAERGSLGDAGAVTVRTEALIMEDPSFIETSALFGSGDAGPVAVTAESIVLRGSFIGSGSAPTSAGKSAAGPVTVTAKTLIMDSSLIQSVADGRGDGGPVTVTAESLAMRNGSDISSLNIAGADSPVPLDGGDAAPVTITVRTLTMDESFIDSAALYGNGNGGPLTIRAGSAALRNGSRIGMGAAEGGTSGSVAITAETLALDGSAISSSAFGSDGGPVTVTAKTLTMDDSSVDSAALLGGDGGPVTVAADTLKILNHSVISTTAEGGGAAGRIRVGVGHTLTMAHGSSIESSGRADPFAGGSGGPAGDVLIRAERTTIGDSAISTVSDGTRGGRITLEATDLLHLIRAEVTSNGIVPGEGDSVITLRAPMIMLNRSRVVSLTGAGVPLAGSGEARLLGDMTVISADSEVAATSTVEITGQDAELGSQLAAPESAFLDSARLRERCATRQDVGASSFTGVGRAGLPPSPDAPLASAHQSVNAIGVAPVRAGFEPARGAVPAPSPPCRPWK